MVEIPLDIITSVGAGLPTTLASNLIVGFVFELGKAVNEIAEQRRYDIPPVSYESLEDFWKAYKKHEVRKGDSVCVYGAFSDLGLAMPASSPDEALRAAKKSLEELSHWFSDDSELNVQEQIMRVDAQIDMLRLWLGSCMRPLPIKEYRYCTLFDETDIIPVRGLPIFVRENVRIGSPPFYGEVRGYVADLPPYWKGVLKVKSEKPLAIVVDSRNGGKIESFRDLVNPLYLSYWIVLRYTNGTECVVATRGDYTSKENYKACRDMLKTIARVEVEKLSAQMLFEYDQVNRLTRYKQILDQGQIDKILKHREK